jgi:hypothetical protein
MEIPEKCPQFETCSVNRCPLHPDYGKLECIEPDRDERGEEVEWTGDPERRCRALRKTREGIAAEHPELTNGGLLDAEIARDRKRKARREAWDALPPEARAERLAKLAEMRTKIHPERK